ncbi:MAG: ribbon-helix-helix domain-containing protein [Candidatus Odinarchaeia archaeon]
MENLSRISLTIPKNLVEKLDEITPNRSSFITRLLEEKLFGKSEKIISLKIKSKKTLKYILDPANKFLLDVKKFNPIIAVSIEYDPLNGPVVKIVSQKMGASIFVEIDLSILKNDSEYIRDSEDWLELANKYEPDGEFVSKILEGGGLIVDKIEL